APTSAPPPRPKPRQTLWHQSQADSTCTPSPRPSSPGRCLHGALVLTLYAWHHLFTHSRRRLASTDLLFHIRNLGSSEGVLPTPDTIALNPLLSVKALFLFSLGGFLYLDEVLNLRQFKGVSEEEVITVVEKNNKQRFELRSDPNNPSRTQIRAFQGHSVPLRLDFCQIAFGISSEGCESCATRGRYCPIATDFLCPFFGAIRQADKLLQKKSMSILVRVL
ncbi:unnamed protein product, partial [Protopolystoma xenopodis]